MTATVPRNDVELDVIVNAPKVCCESDDKPAVAMLTHPGCAGYKMCADHRATALTHLAKPNIPAWGCPRCGLVGPFAVPSHMWTVRPI